MGKKVQLTKYEIKEKKLQAIPLLADTNKSYTQVAQELGIHRNTLLEWRKDTEFLKAVNDYAIGMLSEASVKAAQTMMDLLKAKSELVRFQAAKEILDKNELTQKDKLLLKKLEKEIDRGDESTTETNLADALIKLAGGNSDT